MYSDFCSLDNRPHKISQNIGLSNSILTLNEVAKRSSLHSPENQTEPQLNPTFPRAAHSDDHLKAH